MRQCGHTKKEYENERTDVDLMIYHAHMELSGSNLVAFACGFVFCRQVNLPTPFSQTARLKKHAPLFLSPIPQPVPHAH